MTDSDQIRVLDILLDTTADGPGFRTSIYAAGCAHHCRGCHNPQSWSFAGGSTYSIDELLDIVLKQHFADVTFSGGDPFYQPLGFAKLARKIKSRSSKTIWCYTGFVFEELLESTDKIGLLESIDVLVDGPFQLEFLDSELPFRGSSNQRIVDVKRSLQIGRITEYGA